MRMIAKTHSAFAFLTLFCCLNVRAATLLECDWDNGTGTSEAAITGGTWLSGDSSVNAYEVYADDGTSPGGRNFLRVRMPPSGAYTISGHTSFDDPSILFIRYWMRLLNGDGPAGVHTIHFGHINADGSDTDLFVYY